MIESLEGARLVGCSLKGSPSECELSQEFLFAGHEEALDHSDVQGVIICTSLGQRDYWIAQAAAKRKPVFCESPIAATFSQASAVVHSCSVAGVELAVRAKHLSSALDADLRRLMEEQIIGPLLFFDLKVSIPKRYLLYEKEGVLLRYGLDYLTLLDAYLGPVDSIYARTRSLGLNRPAEDIAVVQLWFKSGLEGTIQFNGLGERDEVCFELYGRQGTVKTGNRWGENLEGLRLQYMDFVECILHGRRSVWSGEKALGGHYCVHWIHQAARQRKEISKPEVRTN